MGAVDRASASDRAFLAMDRGPVPSHVAAVLLLEPGAGFDPAVVAAVVEQRIRAVPRLRQRLVRTPLGCGGPVWVDDETFDIRNHVRGSVCPPPGDERALLDAVAAVVTRPLPRSSPLWIIEVVSGLAGGRVAMVVVLHHVVADGVGGLAVLASLADVHPGNATRVFPRPPPPTGRLFHDALTRRLRSVRHAPDAGRALWSAMTAAGGLAPPPATACSLLRRTGPGRRIAVVHADRSAVRAAAHRAGGTVNDAVLVSIAGALRHVLDERGETVDAFTVAVPVAGRRTTDASALGNQTSPLLVTVPAVGDPEARIGLVAADVRARRPLATGPPPIALLGPVFRPMAALGGYRWYMNHQRRLHTLVSHVHGPDAAMTFAGARVTAVVPVAVAEAGNMAISFEALSYAGTLTVSAIADPDAFADLPALAEALADELAAFGPSQAGLHGASSHPGEY